MRNKSKILIVVLCLTTFFTLGAKPLLLRRLENLESTVQTLDKRVNYLERRLRVNRTVIPGHETYYGDDPVHTAVSGEDLIRYHRAIEEAERKSRTRRGRFRKRTYRAIPID